MIFGIWTKELFLIWRSPVKKCNERCHFLSQGTTWHLQLILEFSFSLWITKRIWLCLYLGIVNNLGGEPPAPTQKRIFIARFLRYETGCATYDMKLKVICSLSSRSPSLKFQIQVSNPSPKSQIQSPKSRGKGHGLGL